jgi:hypothetical protein
MPRFPTDQETAISGQEARPMLRLRLVPRAAAAVNAEFPTYYPYSMMIFQQFQLNCLRRFHRRAPRIALPFPNQPRLDDN